VSGERGEGDRAAIDASPYRRIGSVGTLPPVVHIAASHGRPSLRMNDATGPAGLGFVTARSAFQAEVWVISVISILFRLEDKPWGN
jgi:hypothetical protein